MNFDELLEKYRELQKENRLLKEKIKLFESHNCSDAGNSDAYTKGVPNNRDKTGKPDEVTEEKKINSVNNYSSPSITRLSQENIETFSTKLCKGNELGILKKDDENETSKPWESQNKVLNFNDFPEIVEIVKSSMLFIPKTGFSQKALNRIKRLAAFINSDFYKAQAMRLSTAEETMMRIESPKIAYDLIESMGRRSSAINSGRN